MSVQNTGLFTTRRLDYTTYFTTIWQFVNKDQYPLSLIIHIDLSYTTIYGREHVRYSLTHGMIDQYHVSV